MTLGQQEYDAIIADDTKRVDGDIHWVSVQNALALSFRVDIDSDEAYPLFLQGRYNAYSGKLSFAIIYRGVGRIYGLDLGAAHVNPDRGAVGDPHKNYWRPGYRDKWAYVPYDITHPWSCPVDVWRQFCAEANIQHRGSMHAPGVQLGMIL